MEAMERHILPTKAQTGRKIYILYGLGGTGKTQLAIAHARKHQHTYSAILWVNGNSRDTVLQSLSAFGRRAGVDGRSEPTTHAAQQAPDIEAEAAAVLRWFALEGNHRWLMVFDNIDRDVGSSEEDAQAFKVTSFLPSADHGSVLITTRLSSLRVMGQSTKVGSLQLDQSQELLSHHSGLHPASPGKISVPSEPRNASLIIYFTGMATLIERLGYLALALVQAGTYMHETQTGCSKYLDLYEASWTQLAAETPHLLDYENGSIQTTWMISYERVRQDNRTAGKLLQLWGNLDHQDVWYGLFLRGRDGCQEEYSWLQELTGSEIGFKRVMKSLLAYSLIESHRDRESYSMHPVVHDWCAETISAGQGDLMLAALTIVGTAAPDHSEAEFWLLQQRLLLHADQCVRQLDDLEALHHLESVESSDALHNIGSLFADQGKYTEAEKIYRRALDGSEKVSGPGHTSTLNTVNNLGVLYQKQGKLVEAEKMYQRALEGNEKVSGPGHISTLNTVNNLGVLYRNQGKLVEAEEMYRRALEGQEKVLGPDHISTLSIVNNLGELCRNQGKLVEAEKIYQRALEGKEKALGPDHISTLNTVNNLGLLYADQGKLVEAEKIYQRALEGKEKALGPDHISTLSTVHNLGTLYAGQGKLVEAEKMYQRALDGKVKVLGPGHPSTLSTSNNLRLLNDSRGKHI